MTAGANRGMGWRLAASLPMASRPVNASAVRQFLLGETACLSQFAHPPSELGPQVIHAAKRAASLTHGTRDYKYYRDMLAASRYDWSRLNHHQVGRYAEYFVKMEFTRFGFEVYTTEVDDRCVDLVVRRRDDKFYDVQVKSVRGYTYIFVPKAKFQIADHRLLAPVVFHPNREPDLYLIPMTAWEKPNALLVSHDYEGPGQKSKPEWGLNLSAKNQHLLDPYSFRLIAPILEGSHGPAAAPKATK
jgi:hypothetical protein